jgi:hypothetical protein
MHANRRPGSPIFDGTTQGVAEYKIDITAQCPSGNSAFCFYFAKQ